MNHKYKIYHIPGKKVGVTTSLLDRVTKQQGYDKGEYEVLFSTDDITLASNTEKELQIAFGYKVDRQTYKELIDNKNKTKNQMKINVTAQTTTFPCPVSELETLLNKNLGMDWETEHGSFHLDARSISWVLSNVKTSMYNDNRCYVYNKALQRFYDNNPGRSIRTNVVESKIVAETNCATNKLDCQRFDLIRSWAKERGIYKNGDMKTQYVKLAEEFGETGKAILKSDMPEIIDGIGDMVVVLTNLAELAGTSIEDCIDAAYNEIANRKGKMIDGTFVKASDLTKTL